MASSEQYSPEQVLSMGRDAEAAGNLEYALKVYAYLAEHFGETPEAMAARHGHDRIMNWQRAELARHSGGEVREQPLNSGAASPGRPGERVAGGRPGEIPPALNAHSGHAGRDQDAASQRPPPLSNRLDALRTALPPEPVRRDVQGWAGEHRSVGSPVAGTHVSGGQGPSHLRPAPHSSRVHHPAHENHSHLPQGHAGHGGAGSHQAVARERSTLSTGLVPAEPGLPRMIARSASESDEAVGHEPYRRYRVGSFLASFMAVMGWLAVLSSLVLLTAMISGFGAAAVPSLGRPGAFGLSIGSQVGAAALAFGLLAVFVSQIAHALFDQANAALALLEIEQSRGDY